MLICALYWYLLFILYWYILYLYILYLCIIWCILYTAFTFIYYNIRISSFDCADKLNAFLMKSTLFASNLSNNSWLLKTSFRCQRWYYDFGRVATIPFRLYHKWLFHGFIFVSILRIMIMIIVFKKLLWIFANGWANCTSQLYCKSILNKLYFLLKCEPSELIRLNVSLFVNIFVISLE